MTFNPTSWSRRIEAIPPRRFIIAAATSIVAIGFVDHFTGPIVSLAIFYLVPDAASAWVVGRGALTTSLAVPA